MRISRNFVLVPAVALAVALAGCGGSSGSGGVLNPMPSSTTSTPIPQTTATATSSASAAATATATGAATATASASGAASPTAAASGAPGTASPNPGPSASGPVTPTSSAPVTPAPGTTATPTAPATATASASPTATATATGSSTAFVVTTLAGSGAAMSVDGTGKAATFNGPVGIAYASTAQGDPTLFVDDGGSGFLRGYDMKTAVVTTLDSLHFTAGSFFGNVVYQGTAANNLYLTSGANVAQIALPTTPNPAATPNPVGKALGTPAGIALDSTGDIFTLGASDGNFYEIVYSTALFARASLATTFPPGGNYGLVVTGTPATAYFTDNALDTLSSATTTAMMATATTIATGAPLNSPAGMTLLNGNLYIANCGGNDIIKATTAGVLTVVAGSGASSEADGAGKGASFNCPFGITNDGTNLFVTDQGGNTVREITSVS